MNRTFHGLRPLGPPPCLLVLAIHSAGWNADGHVPRWLLAFGFAGVDLFFAISGFIIVAVHYDQIGDPQYFRAYVRKRWTRIYPPYWVCYGATAFVIAVWLGQ